MPSLQDIERFKAVLNSLGSEEEILAERGESIEDLPPPASGPPDLSDLFAGETAQGRESPQGPEISEGRDLLGGAETVPGSETSPAAEPGAEEFDLSSLFGEEGMEELDKLELPPEPAGAEAPTEPEIPGDFQAEIQAGSPPLEEPGAATGQAGGERRKPPGPWRSSESRRAFWTPSASTAAEGDPPVPRSRKEKGRVRLPSLKACAVGPVAEGEAARLHPAVGLRNPRGRAGDRGGAGSRTPGGAAKRGRRGDPPRGFLCGGARRANPAGRTDPGRCRGLWGGVRGGALPAAGGVQAASPSPLPWRRALAPPPKLFAGQARRCPKKYPLQFRKSLPRSLSRLRPRRCPACRRSSPAKGCSPRSRRRKRQRPSRAPSGPNARAKRPLLRRPSKRWRRGARAVPCRRRSSG